MKATIRRIVPTPVWQAARRIKRRLEFKRIQARVPVTKQRLRDDFAALGLVRGDVLLVHTSLRSLGFVQGGPDAVIDALMETVGDEGTLAFPTFTIVGSMSETLMDPKYVFDPATSASTTGKITDVFRAREGVYRSVHPTHSVAAWGRRAIELTATHLEDGSNFGPSSPFGKLLEFDGKTVGLGVNFGPVTMYHAYEDMHLDRFPGVYAQEMRRARIKTSDGDREILMRVHDPAYHRHRIDKSHDIEAYFADYFRKSGVAHFGPVGDSTSFWMGVREMFDAMDRLYAQGTTIYRVPSPGSAR